MSRSYYRRRRYYQSRADRGHEIARQHIAQAKQLTTELAGADEDVKDWFFKLNPDDIRIILDLYQSEYGANARAYAATTIESWRTGRVQMAGQTAERLFKILPPVMPLPLKYRIIETLWAHYGPSSKKALRIGLDASVDDAMPLVAQHIESVLVHYRIPDNLERRFDWLAAGDSHMKQALLGHLRQMEKRIVIEGARLQLPTMLAHMRSPEGRNTHRLAQILTVGKHELELSLDKGFSGVALVDPIPAPVRSTDSAGNIRWIFWLIGIGLLALFLLHK